MAEPDVNLAQSAIAALAQQGNGAAPKQRRRRGGAASAEFARHCGAALAPVGEFALRGFDAAQTVFGLADEVDASKVDPNGRPCVPPVTGPLTVGTSAA